jgi:hypothetical protein
MSSNNKDQTSTLQGYADQASGAVQSALGSLTGSTADQVRLTHSSSVYAQATTNNAPRSKAKTRKTLPPPKKISRTRRPKPAPSPSAPRAASPKTTRTVPTVHGTRTLVLPRRPSAALSAPRASSRRAFVRTRRARARRLLVR